MLRGYGTLAVLAALLWQVGCATGVGAGSRHNVPLGLPADLLEARRLGRDTRENQVRIAAAYHRMFAEIRAGRPVDPATTTDVEFGLAAAWEQRLAGDCSTDREQSAARHQAFIAAATHVLGVAPPGWWADVVASGSVGGADWECAAARHLPATRPSQVTRDGSGYREPVYVTGGLELHNMAGRVWARADEHIGLLSGPEALQLGGGGQFAAGTVTDDAVFLLELAAGGSVQGVARYDPHTGRPVWRAPGWMMFHTVFMAVDIGSATAVVDGDRLLIFGAGSADAYIAGIQADTGTLEFLFCASYGTRSPQGRDAWSSSP